MNKTFPQNLILTQTEEQAASLLGSFLAGDDEAISRVRQHLPHVRHLERAELPAYPLSLKDARTVIAREYGLKSWGALRLAIKLNQSDYGDALEQFKRLVYARDAAGLDALLQAHPELRQTLDDPHFDFGSTAVIIAKSDLDVVDALLKHGANINAKSQWWAGDFHVLELASAELAGALIERGALVTVHAAAEQGWLDWLDAAYEKDPAIVNQRGGDGKTPLHYAQAPAVMDWLLARGADLEARDLDHESTALQWKIGEGNHDAARELIKRGATVDIFAAVVLGELELVRTALEWHPHAIRARVNQAGYELTPRADGSHQYVYAFSGAGMSPHQVALEYGHGEIFDYLVEQSPLDARLLAFCAAGEAAAAREIVAANPEIVSKLGESDQRQLLHAAWTGQLEVVKLMAALGFNLHIYDDDAMMPLHWAAFHGHDDVVALLLDEDDDPPLEWLNGYGGTPLTTCFYGSQHTWLGGGGHAACAQLLVEAGSPISEAWLPHNNEAFDAILRAAFDRRRSGG
ncbi:MAG: ankyrin repeat domain-containing protein [Chloroflexota bacterium]|nr:ankyrin repeat domain-containing protein [Chloroflexota bacterium]